MVEAPRGTPRARLRLRASLVAVAVASLALLVVPSAASAKKWVVKGAGFGHGTGMSQYGAKGFAARGTPYSSILAHYYTGTTLGTAPSQTVRVLLRPYLPSVRFRGAGSACGVGLKPGKTYVAKRKGAGVVLRTKKGITVAKCSGLLSAAGAPTVELIGKGAYRGALEVRPSSVPGKLKAINAVEIEDYLKGVVPKESPASWPIEALKAQAVAARSFAIATPVRGNGFDQYDDTRSQLYGGVSAENTRTNQAVDATRSQVVLYNGKVAQTFFFSTSGGHTENNEHSSLGFGGAPIPYLRGVPDPYEAEARSPYYRWKRKFSLAKMNSLLGGLVRGKLKKVVVTQLGASPRIVRANLIGSRGTTTVTGPELRDELGLPDTWATFKKK
ncbi:MAG TPA: SpoIID/LytB domain-containing protein [Solirubrobacterales bacterium]|nr:SpoIID/LytB domain-containing protein [Solirubrobacterales bacterium]